MSMLTAVQHSTGQHSCGSSWQQFRAAKGLDIVLLPLSADNMHTDLDVDVDKVRQAQTM